MLKHLSSKDTVTVACEEVLRLSTSPTPVIPVSGPLCTLSRNLLTKSREIRVVSLQLSTKIWRGDPFEEAVMIGNTESFAPSSQDVLSVLYTVITKVNTIILLYSLNYYVHTMLIQVTKLYLMRPMLPYSHSHMVP